MNTFCLLASQTRDSSCPAHLPVRSSPCLARAMRILNVAEKPSMARQITTLLSGEDFDSVRRLGLFVVAEVDACRAAGGTSTAATLSSATTFADSQRPW